MASCVAPFIKLDPLSFTLKLLSLVVEGKVKKLKVLIGFSRTGLHPHVYEISDMYNNMIAVVPNK